MNALAFRPLVTHLVPALFGVTEKIVGLLTILAIESLVLVLLMSQKAQRRYQRRAGALASAERDHGSGVQYCT